MRYIQYFVVFTMMACQIKDEGIPKPEDAYVKYYGQGVNQRALDLEPIYTAEENPKLEGLVIMGTREVVKDENVTVQDFYFIKTDENGGSMTEASHDFSFQFLPPEDTSQVTLYGTTIEGQVRHVGSEFIFIGTSRVLNENVGSESITYDTTFAVFGRLDSDLNLLGKIEVIKKDALGNDLIQTSNGDLVIAGAVRDNEGGFFNFFATRLDPSLEILWESTTLNGSIDEGDDVLLKVFENDNGDFDFFGYTARNGTGNGERGRSNVYYKRLSAINGGILSTNTVGTQIGENVEIDDELTDVYKYPGGYIAVGTAFETTENRYAFTIFFNKEGFVSVPEKLLTEDTVSEAYAVTQTRFNDFVVVGSLPGFVEGNDEAVFFEVDAAGRRIGDPKNFGLINGNDESVDVITLPDGKIMVLNTADFGGGISLISLIKLNDDGAVDQ